MIAPSDLNRIPRWAPAPRSEELSRYLRSELGSESAWLAPPVARSRGPVGIRAWIRARLRFSRAVRPESPTPLRTGLGAVHFHGEMEDHHAPPAPAVLAASALAFPLHREDAEPEELCSCNP